MITPVRSATLTRHRMHWLEPVFWTAALLVYFFYPQYLAVATSVLIMALFALSFDLVIGFAGILTLGHGFYFGVGAYSAGLIAKFAWNEAITGALAAGGAAAALAATLGPFVLRLTGLPLIMVTLGISVIMFEAGNKAGWITGGDDGLTGFTMAPLFGTVPLVAVRPHEVSLRAGLAVRPVLRAAARGGVALRGRAAGHPRKPAAHATRGRARAAAPGRRLHHRRGRRWDRRRAVGANERLRRHSDV